MRKRILQTANKQNDKTGFNSLRLVVLLLFVAFSTSAHAYRLRDADVTVVNGVITQCTYDINSLGNIIEIPETLDGQTITGLGDYCFQLAGKIKEVSLPATLKTIGIGVFQNHNLTNVVLPEGITSIGVYAFSENSIESINLPNSITSIGYGAFYINQIKSIQIPIGLTEIEGYSFNNNQIQELSIPQSITSIKGGAFMGNYIKNLFIPKSVFFIGESSFASNSLESLVFEDGCKLTHISTNCFSANKLSQVVLPSEIKLIDNSAFSNNLNLTSFQFNNGLKKIGKRAFSGCKLSTVDLPDDLIYIGAAAFQSNPIVGIKLPNQSIGEKWTVSDGSTRNNGDIISNFELSYIVPVQYTLKDDDVVVENGIINSCSYFGNVENLGNSIVIPDVLDGQEIVGFNTELFFRTFLLDLILPNTLKNISFRTAYDCELSSIRIPASVESIGESSFGNNHIRLILFELNNKLKIIDNGAFTSNKLTTVSIPSSVSRIGREAFTHNPISNVFFEQPSQLISIESNAFNYNTTLSEINLPEPVIAGYEYQGWIDGLGVTHKIETNNLKITNFETFYRVLLTYMLTDDDVVVDKGVILSCSYDFTASNIIIPDTLDGQKIIGLGNYVFANKSITNIVLPTQLKFIGFASFEKNNLSEIILPATLDSIGYNAFFNNYINKITFEEGAVIRYIGINSFRANNIDTLIIPKSVEYIDYQAFSGSKIEYLEFEDGSNLIFLGEGAFAYNTIGHDIVIPPLLKEIGKNAFFNNKIIHVYLHNNVTDIGEGAFLGLSTTPTIDPLPTPETIPFVTWFIRWRDSDNNTLVPGYVITDFTKGYRALIDQYMNVKFQVYDDNGLALQGATIQFSDSLMITNAFGRDSIAPVMRGVHNYTVSATGCLSQSASVDVQDDTFLQVILNRLYAFHVNVVDNNNVPLQNVHIEIGDSILQSSAQGEATLLLVDGNYTCVASLPGYSIGSADFVIHDADASIIIQLNPATITYHPNGGAETAFSETATGSTYQIQNNSFTRLGYRFIGWNTLANGSGTSHAEGANLTLAPGDLNLYAIWQLNTYQISYDLRGGQNDLANPATYTINSATIQLKPAIATASTEAYFEGWYDADGNKVETIPQGSTGDINLWASFIAEPSYLINYQNIMNGIHSNPNTYTQNDLPLTFLPANQNGYNFMGWYSENTFNTKIESLAAESKGDTTLYARWEPIVYSIQYIMDGGTNATQNPASYTIESSNITLQAAAKQGYTFEGWFSDENFTQAITSIASGSTGNKTAHAKWSLETYSIQYILNGGTNATQNPANYTIESSGINLHAATKHGYTFEGWFSDENFTQAIASIPAGRSGDKTVYAKWNLETYSIQYVLNGGTNAMQNPANYTIESSSITLQAAAKQGYVFEGWFSDENFTQAITSIASGSTGNKIVYAKWSLETYSIQYVLNGGTNAAQNPASYTIESSNITLQSAAKQGYTFEGWFSDENFTQPITSIPPGSTGNKTVYAKWTSLYLLNFEITTDGSTPAPNVSVIVNNANPLISDNNGLVQLPCENNFKFTYRVVLDDVEITSGSGAIQSTDQLVKIEIVNAYMRWYDVIFCDNGLHLWTAFEWQKSGQPIGNEQFYHKNGGIESGQYSLIVTSKSGKQYTWTKSYQNNLFSLSVFPNPVLKSQELTIEINGIYDFDGCELLIYNSSGQIAHKTTQVESLNHVQLSSAIKEGIYLMVLTQNGKQLSYKRFVVR